MKKTKAKRGCFSLEYLELIKLLDSIFIALFFKTLKLTIMETKENKKVSWKEYGDFLNKVSKKAIEALICTQVCLIGLEIMHEVRENKKRDRVKGHYRLIGNKLRWINGYWRSKRTLQERH